MALDAVMSTNYNGVKVTLANIDKFVDNHNPKRAKYHMKVSLTSATGALYEGLSHSSTFLATFHTNKWSLRIYRSHRLIQMV